MTRPPLQESGPRLWVEVESIEDETRPWTFMGRHRCVDVTEEYVPRSVADALAAAVELIYWPVYQGSTDTKLAIQKALAAYRAGGNTNEETG